MKIDVIKYDYTPASGKEYDVRLEDGVIRRYVEFTRAELLELREKIDSVLSDEDTAPSPTQSVSKSYVGGSVTQVQGIEAARDAAAERNARMFGTDPSWYGR